MRIAVLILRDGDRWRWLAKEEPGGDEIAWSFGSYDTEKECRRQWRLFADSVFRAVNTGGPTVRRAREEVPK